jgi:hypothetical protein
MNMLLSIVAMTFGTVAVVSPTRAAKIWGTRRLDGLTAKRHALFLRWYRVFGVVLFLGGALFALDSMGFWNYRR